MRSALLALVVTSSSLLPLAAQEVVGKHGPRTLLPRDHEVALARSAAPASVSGNARVWFFANGRYEIADSGTTTVECYVSRSWPESLEPHCFDEEGAATIMRIDMRTTELLHAGRLQEDVEREIAVAIASGTFRLPARPAMSWMLSSAQVLFNDDGRRVGAWQPHVMIYFPYMTAVGIGTGANDDLSAGILVRDGEATSNIMIVVPTAVDPALPYREVRDGSSSVSAR